MSRELAGKVAIATGAATGIGKAITFAFGAASTISRLGGRGNLGEHDS
jgi:NAD(P)-dependent dehydrogenase (short-subunit alcohol dehydrogenase family)